MVKTKKLILQEFKKLLSKHSLDKITVSQITDKCNIKRQTFYYHFNNIDDLISYGSKSYIKDIIGSKEFGSWQKKFIYILETIKEEKDSFFYLIMTRTAYNLAGCIFDIFKDEVMETVEVLKSEYSLTRKDEEFIVDFYSYGLTGIVLKWFDEGMEEDPKVLVYKIESIIEGTSKKAFQKFAL